MDEKDSFMVGGWFLRRISLNRRLKMLLRAYYEPHQILICIMNRETLSNLELKDLQHYRDTLSKRIQELKKFNIELGKDNVDLAAKINSLRAEAHKKTVTKGNFDFDDLYRIGKEKVGKLASKEGMKNILSSGGKQIKKGLGLAENIVRRYIQHPKSEQEEQVNIDADFNSYDLRPMNQLDIKSENVPQRQYNPAINVEQEPERSTANNRRKKIFDKPKQNPSQAVEKPAGGEDQGDDKDEYAIKSDEEIQKSQSREEDESKEDTNVQVKQETPKKSEDEEKVQDSHIINPADQKEQKKQSQTLAKQMQISPNKIVDLENHSSDNSDEESSEKKEKQIPKTSKDTSPAKQDA